MVIEHVLNFGELKVCKAAEDLGSNILVTIITTEREGVVESYVACHSGMYSQNEGVAQK